MSDALASLVGDFVIRENHIGTNPTAQKIVGPDPTRWGLILSVSASGDAFVATTDTSISTSGGILVSSTSPGLQINFRDWGALVNLAWFVTQVSPGARATAIEVLYRPSGPTMSLDDLVMELAQLRRQSRSIPDHYHRQLSELRQHLSSHHPTAGRK
jgi:hypothetical protein